MKKRVISSLVFIVAMAFIFYAIHTFAILRQSAQGTGSIKAATWSVTRSQSQEGDSIDVTPGVDTDTYTLTVQSASEVDVVYKIIISNLPTGVEVDLDNTGFQSPSAGTLTIQNANTVINYNDGVKTKTHTLTFRALDGTTPISQEIDIDVEFKQNM